MIEQWKDIVGYEGLYQVSSLGRIKSVDKVCGKRRGIVKSKMIAIQDNGNGYFNAALYSNGKMKRIYVHRLVADAFLGKENGKEYVNHIDGNKSNNSLSNLEWCTRSENMKHAYDNGLAVQYERSGTKNPAARVVIDLQSGVFYETMKEVSELYKISVSYLSSMLNGRMPNKTNFRYV
jgi:hypothetical protein